MEENFAAMAQEFSALGRAEVLAKIESGEIDTSNSETFPDAIAATALSTMQKYIELGQSQVEADLTTGEESTPAEAPVAEAAPVAAPVEVQASPQADSLTNPGTTGSTTEATFNFLPAEQGTVDASGNAVYGSVEAVINGETTPLFTLGANGPNSSSLSDSSGIGGVPSFVTDLIEQGLIGAPPVSLTISTFES